MCNHPTNQGQDGLAYVYASRNTDNSGGLRDRTMSITARQHRGKLVLADCVQKSA